MFQLLAELRATLEIKGEVLKALQHRKALQAVHVGEPVAAVEVKLQRLERNRASEALQPVDVGELGTVAETFVFSNFCSNFWLIVGKL